MLGPSSSKSIELLCPECGASKTIFGEPGSRCREHGLYYVAAKAVGHPESDDLLGRVVGEQYLVFDRVGHGGMGSVFKAVHLKLKRHVAVKMIRPSVAHDEDSEQLAQRFAFEAQSLSRLSHRNIVTVFDYGETSGLLYLVLEFVEGQTIASMIRELRTVPLEDTVELVSQLLDALKEMHAQGIVHRDIKPSNLMVETKGAQRRLVLIDFGVAKGKNEITGDFRRDLTRTGMAVGTPLYMSPEVLQDGELGPWSDLYAVGVLLYHMLAGRAPFSGPAAEIITAHLRDPVPKLPTAFDLAEMDEVIGRAMAKDPIKRYESTDEFKAALMTTLELALVSSPRVRTQIVKAPFSGNGAERTEVLDEAPSAEVDRSILANTGAPASSDNAEETQSVDAFSGKPSVPKFSMAVTEPHRFDFNIKPEFVERPPSRNALSALLVGVAIVSVVVTVLMFSDYKTWFTGGSDTETDSEMQSQLKGENTSKATLTSPEGHAAAKSLPGQQKTEEVKTSPLPTVTKKTVGRARPSAGKTIRRTKRVPRQRPSKKVHVPKTKSARTPSSVKKTMRQRAPKNPTKDVVHKPQKGMKTETVRNAMPTDDKAPRLLKRFDQELDNCQCDKTELTIHLLADRVSSGTLGRLKERRNEACGVLGQGCQR